MDEIQGVLNNLFTQEQSIDENTILKRPWALNLMKRVEQLAKDSVLQWCNKIISIGEGEIQIEDWTEIFIEQIKLGFEDLNSDVNNLQEKVMDNIEDLLSNLQQVCKDLHVKMPMVSYDKLSFYEIKSELEKLVERYNAIAHVKRKELKELLDKQADLCKNLEAQPFEITLSPLPLPDDVEALRKHIEKLEAEKFIREERYIQLRSDIIQIVSELKIHPSLEFEREILSTSDMEFLITESNMKQLESYHDSLIKQQKSVKEEVSHLRRKIDELWEILEEDLIKRDEFRQRYTGNSLETLDALKTEVSRCEDLKKQNIKVFIDKCRKELISLWEACHCSESQRNEFQFLHSDIYSEDLLELYEREIEKWNHYHNENRELINLIEKHLSLWNQMLELERNAEGPGRYRNRGGKLLVEEKSRNKLAKKIPEYEERLFELAELFEARRGHPFTTFGVPLKNYIEHLHEEREEERKMRLTTKKQLRENTLTPARSCSNLLGSVSSAIKRTPTTVRRLLTPATDQKVQRNIRSNKTKSPTLVVVKSGAISQARRLSQERRKRIQKYRRFSQLMALKQSKQEGNKENINSTHTTEYDEFEKFISEKEGCRSTIFSVNEEVTDAPKKTPRKVGAKSKLGTPKTPRRDQLEVPGSSNSKHSPFKTPRTPGKSPNTLSRLKAAPNLKLIF